MVASRALSAGEWLCLTAPGSDEDLHLLKTRIHASARGRGGRLGALTILTMALQSEVLYGPVGPHHPREFRGRLSCVMMLARISSGAAIRVLIIAPCPCCLGLPA